MPDFIDECKTLLVALIPFIYLIVRNHTNFCLEKDGMYLPFISAVMICIKIIFCSVVFFKSVQFFVGFFLCFCICTRIACNISQSLMHCSRLISNNKDLLTSLLTYQSRYRSGYTA